LRATIITAVGSTSCWDWDAFAEIVDPRSEGAEGASVLSEAQAYTAPNAIATPSAASNCRDIPFIRLGNVDTTGNTHSLAAP
jgi:hypothetical protein